jgi:BMFP domain-containing protein YqiC
MEPKHLDDLARTVMDSLPKGFQALQADAEKNLHSALQAALTRMNLVSREEFDVQTGVLARTREKLERLERLVVELEQKVLDKS